MRQINNLSIYSFRQRGIAALWVLGLLVLGVAAGTYVVSNGTGFLPHAAGKTVACDGQTLSGQSEQSKADFFAIYGGTTAAEEWVAEHERDLVRKGIPCKDPGGYAPGIGTGSNANKTTQPGASAVCKEPEAVATTYYDAKVANNLVRFYAIVEGLPQYCVPADLGVGEPENIDGKRLLLCSGKKVGDNLPDLVWRVVDAQNKKLSPVPGKADPVRNTLLEGFEKKLNEAKKKVGII